MKRKLILTVVLMGFISMFSAQEKEIESQLKKCLDKDYSTAGQLNCTYAATKSWDLQMNKYYNLTLKKLPKAQQSKFMSAQKAWLKFRDSEFALIDDYYYYVKEGTMYQVMGASEKSNIVKDRAKQLKVYYDVLDY
jgi:uncharacterized protein YecT (DUF1311 family)